MKNEATAVLSSFFESGKFYAFAEKPEGVLYDEKCFKALNYMLGHSIDQSLLLRSSEVEKELNDINKDVSNGIDELLSDLI
jgi:hypothetical protein